MTHGVQYPEDRDQKLRSLWEKGMSDADIAKELGCSAWTVLNHRKRLGITERPSPMKRRKALYEKQSLGTEMAHFGNMVATYRRLECNLEKREFAEMISVSTQRLTAIEMGLHDCTFTEMQRICKVLKKPLYEALKPRTNTDVNSMRKD